MNSLPQSFLVVNHEGVHRCYISLEQVTDFAQVVGKFAQHKILLVQNVANHPYGRIHLALNSRDSLPIVILDAFKGKLGLQTNYHLVKTGKESWISPRYLSGGEKEASFELRCEFDFEVWRSSGLRLFFALNFNERLAQTWVAWKGQNYRVPFGNVFDTGAICTGNHPEDFLRADSLFTGLDKLMAHLEASTWNADAFDVKWVPTINKLVRFEPNTLKMLSPFNPELITELGVMAHPTLAEITKLIYG